MFFIALVQLLIVYGLFLPMGADMALSNLQLGLLVVATVFIAAGGNVINDVYDLEIDRINKPGKMIVGNGISEKSANTFYIFLTVAGVGLGFYLANSVGRSGFAALFVVIAAMLYLYASYIKPILLAGNLLISILVALSLLIVGVFELLPETNWSNQQAQLEIFAIVWHYALFAFCLNFIREIVKDLQDINGDKNGGVKSLPIVLGRSRTTSLVVVLGIVALVGVIVYAALYLYDDQPALLYFIFLLGGPLLYFCSKAWTAETESDYAHLSNVLKGIMFLGMLSMLVYPGGLLTA